MCGGSTLPSPLQPVAFRRPHLLSPFARRSWPIWPGVTPSSNALGWFLQQLRPPTHSHTATLGHTHTRTQPHTYVLSHTHTDSHMRSHTLTQSHTHIWIFYFSLLVGAAAKGSFILKEQKEVSACVLSNYNLFLSFKTYCPISLSHLSPL